MLKDGGRSRRTNIRANNNGPSKRIPSGIVPNRPAKKTSFAHIFWPQSYTIHANTHIKTSFYEGGPTGLYKISLYAVNRDNYEKIDQWHTQGRFSGLPLLPDRYSLDSVSLLIE